MRKKIFPVFKIVRGDLHSIYRYYQYKLNRETEPVNLVVVDNSINFGYHSYDLSVNIAFGKSVIIYSTKYNKRLEELNSLEVAYFEPVILDCIIPKGSTYYLNEQGEYVSDCIILIKITENVLDN